MKRPHVVILSDVDLGRIDAPMMHTCAVARSLSNAGVTVDLIARGPDPRLHEVAYHPAAQGQVGRAKRIVGVNRRAISVLWHRRRSLDALYVRKDWGSLPAMLSARLLGLRVVTEVNDLPYGPNYHQRERGLRPWLADRFKRRMARLLWRLSTHIVTVTEGLKSLIVAEYGASPATITVLPNGVDTDLVVPLIRVEAAARAGLAEGKTYVVFVGSLESRVDWETMMRAFAEAAQARPLLTLVLVGDGPDLSSVGTLAAEVGVEDRVVRPGFVPERARVNDFIGAASICLVPLKEEARGLIGASPLKLTEYFAAGRAVVATDVPGVREMVQSSGAGLLAPAGDVGAMAAAIGTLADDLAAADTMGDAGRKAAEERYSWTSIAARLVPLLTAPSSSGR
jgi:glycosyltransferase involved in cell wall biosynthesis